MVNVLFLINHSLSSNLVYKCSSVKFFEGKIFNHRGPIRLKKLVSTIMCRLHTKLFDKKKFLKISNLIKKKLDFNECLYKTIFFGSKKLRVIYLFDHLFLITLSPSL